MPIARRFSGVRPRPNRNAGGTRLGAREPVASTAGFNPYRSEKAVLCNTYCPINPRATEQPFTLSTEHLFGLPFCQRRSNANHTFQLCFKISTLAQLCMCIVVGLMMFYQYVDVRYVLDFPPYSDIKICTRLSAAATMLLCYCCRLQWFALSSVRVVCLVLVMHAIAAVLLVCSLCITNTMLVGTDKYHQLFQRPDALQGTWETQEGQLRWSRAEVRYGCCSLGADLNQLRDLYQYNCHLPAEQKANLTSVERLYCIYFEGHEYHSDDPKYYYVINEPSHITRQYRFFEEENLIRNQDQMTCDKDNEQHELRMGCMPMFQNLAEAHMWLTRLHVMLLWPTLLLTVCMMLMCFLSDQWESDEKVSRRDMQMLGSTAMQIQDSRFV